MRHVNIMLAGLVQGVNFRASAKAEAGNLGLSGYVRNNPDGTVSLEVEGKAEAVGEFLVWLESGFIFPGRHDVTVSEGAVKKYESFEIVI